MTEDTFRTRTAEADNPYAWGTIAQTPDRGERTGSLALPDALSIPDLLRASAENRPHDPAIAYRSEGTWKKVGWKEYFLQSQACAAALADQQILPGDRVGLLSENRLEWLVADMGILAASAVTVPIHSTLPEEQIKFQLRDAQASWLFVSNVTQLEKIANWRHSLPRLRGVTLFSGATADVQSWREWLRVEDHRGHRAFCGRKHIDPDSLATIIYTSGTTGNPRGVMLTHGNLVSNLFAVRQAFRLGPDSSTLTWLPLSHIAARTVEHFMSLVTGGTVWLAESPERVLANIAEVQPTNLSGVPRFYEKVLASLAPLDQKERAIRLRALFGSCVKWVTCGSAPLSPGIAEQFEAAGLPLLEGYGLTETAGALTCNLPESRRRGTVGTCLPGVEVKIADDGEILARGPVVTPGYWNSPRATREAIRDGWLHTGDLGALDEDGFLTISGRKKDVLVLSTGKKVIATEVETVLGSTPLIDQAVIYGEGRSFLTALVVPKKQIRDRIADAGESTTDVDDATRQLSEQIRAALCGLPPEMRVKRYLVLRSEFSVAGGELTETLKPRREAILSKHRTALESLYSAPRSDDELPFAQLT